jgi:hypothetical protein
LQILLPSLRGAKLYYSTMIGLNLWQKPQQVRCGGGTLREPNYASQGILSRGGRKRRRKGGEFRHLSLCGNGSLSISRRSRIRDAAGYFEAGGA